MTPLTRKENYLNEIVGWGNTAPEKPTTPEELFFAAILGEAVQVPDLSNASRYELFLAKIAGYNVNISPPTYTSPRLEFFLAKAAGMDVVTPVPLTKEEIFWANYKGIEQIIEGIPPLMFNAIAGTLKNYRIYGNTVDGESVGDRTENLFNKDTVTVNCFVVQNAATLLYSSSSNVSDYIPIENATAYTLSWLCEVLDSPNNRNVGVYDAEKNAIKTFQVVYYGESSSEISLDTPNAAYIRLTIDKNMSNVMFKKGSIAPSYEPYGKYKIPLTLTADSAETTDIYLDAPLAKSGNNADYIDYDTQKRYNADGTSQSIELPTLQTVEGTNTLSVGTTVQPSKVMVKIGEASAYKVRYYVDDTMARVETVSDGKNAQGFTPTKASTVQYNYTFVGWSTTKGSTTAETGVLNDITADKSLYAVFSQSLRTFTVYFYNDSTLLQTAENVQYGGTATYTGETPTKDGFTFSGWQPSNVNITADTSCYAQFVEG